MSSFDNVGDTNSYVGIWSHRDAEKWQVTQISASGCGATALATAIPYLVNLQGRCMAIVEPSPSSSSSSPSTTTALPCTSSTFTTSSATPLSSQTPPLEDIVAGSVLRLRAYDAPLPQYLASRSIAGCTGEELVTSVAKICPRLICGEFLSYSDIMKSGSFCSEGGGVVEWLAAQLRCHKALVATLNLQLYGNDAWHHQFIYGVDVIKRRIYCTNPLEAYSERDFCALISTPSVLLVRRDDVISRIDRPGGDTNIYKQDDWASMNVAEQVRAIVVDKSKDFVMIPAAYVGGVAVFAKT